MGVSQIRRTEAYTPQVGSLETRSLENRAAELCSAKCRYGDMPINEPDKSRVLLAHAPDQKALRKNEHRAGEGNRAGESEGDAGGDGTGTRAGEGEGERPRYPEGNGACEGAGKCAGEYEGTGAYGGECAGDNRGSEGNEESRGRRAVARQGDANRDRTERTCQRGYGMPSGEGISKHRTENHDAQERERP